MGRGAVPCALVRRGRAPGARGGGRGRFGWCWWCFRSRRSLVPSRANCLAGDAVGSLFCRQFPGRRSRVRRRLASAAGGATGAL